jgi:hypothetical protein
MLAAQYPERYFGNPDEQGAFVTPPADWPGTTGTALNSFINLVTTGDYDTQPDIYNFNFPGFSGRFIILNGVIKKLEQNNLQITGNYSDGFIVTTAEGVQYTFNAVEYTKSINSSNGHYSQYIANAWYLTKVTHPSGDIINLLYSSCHYQYWASASQKDIYFEGEEPVNAPHYQPQGEAPSVVKTATQIDVSGLYLTQISSNSSKGGYLKFKYASRQDITNDFALTNIALYDKETPAVNDRVYKNIDLSYAYSNSNTAYNNEYSTYTLNINKRLFMTGLIIDDKNYQFSYIDNGNPSTQTILRAGSLRFL